MFMSFEPTYEELKSSRYRPLWWKSRRFWAYLWGIETSVHSDVKLCLRKFWAYLWGIETDKSWWLGWWMGKFWAYLWGIETWDFLVKYWAVYLFWAYLWGIETSLVKLFGVYSALFWAYLWGIETLHQSWTHNYLHPVLSLPMRNWNKNGNKYYEGGIKVLSLPMRNWNWLKLGMQRHRN